MTWFADPINKAKLSCALIAGGTLLRKSPLISFGLALQAYALHEAIVYGGPKTPSKPGDYAIRLWRVTAAAGAIFFALKSLESSHTCKVQPYIFEVMRAKMFFTSLRCFLEHQI